MGNVEDPSKHCDVLANDATRLFYNKTFAVDEQKTLASLRLQCEILEETPIEFPTYSVLRPMTGKLMTLKR